MYYTKFKTSLCEMTAAGDETGLKILHLNRKHKDLKIPENWTENKDFFNDVIVQLEEYLKGKRKEFDIKLAPEGTEFQKKIWKELVDIPYGQLVTYKYIAIAAGNEKASRAVGRANNKNPIAVIIPCHRVIGSDGKLTGYAGGLDIKEKLIQLEKQFNI